MLRSFLLILFITFSLFASGKGGTLHRANSLMHSSNKSDIFRAYNTYKNLYLQALMNDDEHLRVQSLEGIVKSGHKLRIDVARYEKELKKVHKSTTIKKAKPYIKKPKAAHKNKVALKQKLKLLAARWQDGKLVLTFNKTLQHHQWNYFTKYDAKHKEYSYIVDIDASLAHKQILHKKGVKRITLSRQSSSRMRLEIRNKKPLKVRFSLQNKKFLMSIQTHKQATKKTQHQTVVKETKYIPSKYHGVSHRHKTIVIDAGHGGKDPGAVGYRKYREKVIVLHIAKDLQKILKQRGYRVYMTRNSDHFIKLRNRTKYANRKKADLFISIHANAVKSENIEKAEGVECYFLDKSRSSRAKRVAAQENSADMSEMDYYGKEIFLSTLNSHNIIASNKLAIDLQRGTLASLRKVYKDVKDAGVRPAPFWVLVGAQMPAVLVEVGFITHPKEAQRLVQRSYQQKIAQGLANGIERYFINNQ